MTGLGLGLGVWGQRVWTWDLGLTIEFLAVDFNFAYMWKTSIFYICPSMQCPIPGGLHAFGGPLEGREIRVNLTLERRKAHFVGLDISS